MLAKSKINGLIGITVMYSGVPHVITGCCESGNKYYRMYIMSSSGTEIVIRGHDNIQKLLGKGKIK
jgi:hypothetical protein